MMRLGTPKRHTNPLMNLTADLAGIERTGSTSAHLVKPGEEALILGDVVGDLVPMPEAELHGVVALVSCRGGEYNASPRALPRESAVEVHGPVAGGYVSWQQGFFFVVFACVGICPFRVEIRQSSALDSLGGQELQLERL